MKATKILLMVVLSLMMSAIPLQAGSSPTTSTLEAQVTTLQAQVKSLQAQLTAIQNNNVLKLGAFVTVDPNPEAGVIGPNIVFTGANVHIVSGSGATSDNNNPTGLGNLIIGYNEVWGLAGWAYPGYRGGVHNLIMGSFNRFTGNAYATFVTGVYNTADGPTSIVDGYRNTDHGALSVMLGGSYNIIGTSPGNGICYDNVLISGQLLVEPSSYNVYAYVRESPGSSRAAKASVICETDQQREELTHCYYATLGEIRLALSCNWPRFAAPWPRPGRKNNANGELAAHLVDLKKSEAREGE